MPSGYQPSPQSSALPPDLSAKLRDDDGRWGSAADASLPDFPKPPPAPGISTGQFGDGPLGGSSGFGGGGPFSTDVDRAHGSDYGARRGTSFATDIAGAFDSRGAPSDYGPSSDYRMGGGEYDSFASRSNGAGGYGGDAYSSGCGARGCGDFGNGGGCAGYGGGNAANSSYTGSAFGPGGASPSGGGGFSSKPYSGSGLGAPMGGSMSGREDYDGSRRGSFDQQAGGGPCGATSSVAMPGRGSAMSTAGSRFDEDVLGSSSKRSSWEVGSILEVFSASANRWYAAHIIEIKRADDVLTVQFYAEDGAKQKSMYRSDTALQALGTNMRDLPPGFETRPSQSRPGHVTYFDATTGVKYADPELAWGVHFERLKTQQPAGCQTVAAIKPGMALGAGARVAPPGPAMTLADLQNGGAPGGVHGGMPGAAAAAGPIIDPLAPEGKTPLPCFGQYQASNQMAYLNYVGRVPSENGSPGSAATPQANCGGGMGFTANAVASNADQQMVARQMPSVPRRNHVSKQVNPALQAWQEDPFSEWRS